MPALELRGEERRVLDAAAELENVGAPPFLVDNPTVEVEMKVGIGAARSPEQLVPVRPLVSEQASPGQVAQDERTGGRPVDLVEGRRSFGIERQAGVDLGERREPRRRRLRRGKAPNDIRTPNLPLFLARRLLKLPAVEASRELDVVRRVDRLQPLL